MSVPAPRRAGSPHNQKPDKRKPRAKKRVLPPAHMTAAEAQAKLQSLTVNERRRLRAFFLKGNCKAAAEELQIDPHTVSDTWDKVGALFAVLIDDYEKAPAGNQRPPTQSPNQSSSFA